MQAQFQTLVYVLVGLALYLTALYHFDRKQESPVHRANFRALMSVVTLIGAGGLFNHFTPGTLLLNQLKPVQLVSAGLVVGGFMSVAFFVHEVLSKRAQSIWRYAMAATFIIGFFTFLQDAVPAHKRAVEIAKATIAIVAASCVFYEQHRAGQNRPIADRWKRFVGITLALAAITGYFNGFKFGYPPYYHRWDQYHYYMGAKYFDELGYTDLYKCGVVAQDDIGKQTWTADKDWKTKRARTSVVDMSKEVRDPDKKVRELGGENLLIPGSEVLKNPDHCRNKFTPERWKEYKADIAFFRITSGKGYWTDMQKDHGFNPPPIWTIAGKIFADLNPASVTYMQFLASLDLVYIIGMFIALWWGFGWRVFAVGAIFWGCQASAPFYWTGGAFLRQDWLFFSVLSVACIRKRYFKIAGAALVYAGLLRIFPGLVVIGTLVPTIAYAIKHKRMHKDHQQMLLGGTLAAAVLLAGGAAVSGGLNSYETFYKHTLQTHDKTPLTNHMGLRVMIGHKFIDFQAPGLRNAEQAAQAAGPNASTVQRTLARVKWPIRLSTGKTSGHMQHVRDNRLLDPFEVWKKMRNERYHQYRYLAYAIILGTLLWFIMIVRRIQSLWIAQCLGQIFIILLSQLTCYYYSFMILGAPLIKARKQIQAGLFATAAVTQIIWMNGTVYGTYNDHKYTLLTYASLIWCYVMIGLFWRRSGAAEQAEDDTAPQAAPRPQAS